MKITRQRTFHHDDWKDTTPPQRIPAWRPQSNYFVPQPGPIHDALVSGPRGNADWGGYASVYRKLQSSCEKIGATNLCGTAFHIDTIADMSSGHEERMKARLLILRDRGWL